MSKQTKRSKGQTIAGSLYSALLKEPANSKYQGLLSVAKGNKLFTEAMSGGLLWETAFGGPKGNRGTPDFTEPVSDPERNGGHALQLDMGFKEGESERSTTICGTRRCCQLPWLEGK